MKEQTFNQLSQNDQQLLEAAQSVLGKSYSPYSKFRVGAALRAFDGTIITGANFENASYGGAICAERSALVRANVEGYRTFEAVAIITETEAGPNEKVAAPCGFCRQLLFEAYQLAEEKPLRVILSNTPKSKIIITTIADLLPLGFGPKDLE